MTSDQLTAIRREVEAAMALREKCTPGPWTIDSVSSDDDMEIILDYKIPFAGSPIIIASAFSDDDDWPSDRHQAHANAKLFAHSRTDPTHAHALALLAEVERLNDELAKLKGGA